MCGGYLNRPRLLRDSACQQLGSPVAPTQCAALRFAQWGAHSPFGARAGDGQIVGDCDVHVLLGVIYHAVDGVYVKASVLGAEEFGRILGRHRHQDGGVLVVGMRLGVEPNVCKPTFCFPVGLEEGIFWSFLRHGDLKVRCDGP